MNAVAFSRDGKLLATVSDDMTARLWRLPGMEPSRIVRHVEGWLHAALFSPDGRFLLTASRMNLLFIWDVSTGRLVTTLVGHDSDSTGAAFSPDGRLLLTLHADRTAHVWELSSGERLITLRSRGLHFIDAGFEDAAARFWIRSAGGQRHTWPLDPLPLALSRMPRIQTPYDWERIDLGSESERRARRLEWIRSSLERSVAVAERSMANDPHHRDGLFQHARTVYHLTRSFHREAPSSSGDGLPADRSFTLLGRSLEFLDHAATLPHPPGGIERIRDAVRRELLPALLSYASVDAAIAEHDREVLIELGGEWNLHSGLRAPSTGIEWTDLGFDASGWDAVELPAGAGGYKVATRLAAGEAGATVYLRRVFTIGDPRRWRLLELRVRHDDGFVAFLTGTEVFRVAAGKAGEPPPFGAVASRRARGHPEETVVPLPADALRAGDNVLALVGLNASLEDPDVFLDAALEGTLVPNAERDRGLPRRTAGADSNGGGARVARYLEGRLLQRRRAYREAAELFRGLHAEDSPARQPICGLVESLRATGEAREADQLLRDALASAPPFPDDDFQRLATGAWSILRLPHQDLEAYYRAALWAQRARELGRALSPATLTVVAIARYRLGLLEDAFEMLRLARAGYAVTHGGMSHPRDVAFLAMTSHRLGRKEEARACMLDLLNPARTQSWTESPYVLEASRVTGVPLQDNAQPR